MARTAAMIKVEQTIGYQFRNPELLKSALTAAGADPNNRDGNRKLAQLGQSVLELAIADEVFDMSHSREEMCTLSSMFRSKPQRAAAADAAEIVDCIELCARSGPASNTVKGLAVSAIIGAVWKDSQSMDVVKGAVARL
ncbi:hypothetical protein K4F52_010285, partial [Lecanicillium sp. MT-2017a]